MEQELFKQLAPYGLAGIVIFVLGALVWIMLNRQWKREDENHAERKGMIEHLLDNKKSNARRDARMKRIEKHVTRNRCGYAARPEARSAPGTSSSIPDVTRAAPSLQASGGE